MLLDKALEVWGLQFGRPLKAAVVERWHELFDREHPALLAKAIEIMDRSAERMPTPGMLTKALEIARAYVPVRQRGERHCSCPLCDGTGFRIVALQGHEAQKLGYRQAQRCDCHTEHAVERGTLAAVDPDGTMCSIDARTGEYLYRAQDCEEGRKALAMLAKTAGRRDLSAWYAEGMRGPRPA